MTKLDKKRLLWLISGMVLTVIISALLFFSANAMNYNDDRSHWRQGKNWKPFMNPTRREKQTMMETRMQLAVTACQDNKTENNACTMQGPMGNMTGTCKTQEGKLLCSAVFEGRPIRGNSGPLGTAPK